MAMFAPKCEWVPPTELPDLTRASTIAIDVETRDPGLIKNGPGWPTGEGEVVGYALAIDGWSGYIPIRHLGGGNLDEKIVNRWLKKVFECDADKVMHNAQYDLGWIQHMGLAGGFEVKGRVIDTMIIASLLDENRFSYSLNALAYDYLNKVKSEKTLTASAVEFGLDPKSEMWKLPAQFVGAYAQADAELTLQLWNFFSAKLTQEDLWGVANLELDLLPCLVDMTRRGVRVDVNQVERTRDRLLKREKEVQKEIKHAAGAGVEIWAAQSLSKAFDKLNIQYPTTERGAPSFTKAFLAEHPHPVAKLIVEARALNKTSGTFINSIMKHCRADGRIHSHINQLRSDDGGTVSGRISMRHPNLQQVPARDPVFGPMIRGLFLPEQDQKWASVDFSQQEPRILVHFASAYGKSRGIPLAGAEQFVQAYQDDPKTDFHALVAAMAFVPRTVAKTIGLGLIYGMGVAKLADQLDLEVDAASVLIKDFHTRVPFVKALMSGVANRLNEKSSGGALRSLAGRKCRFDRWEPAAFGMHKALPFADAVREWGDTTQLKRAYAFKSLNRLIQASAADQTKKAMVLLYQAGKLPMLQLHDELALSVDDLQEAQAAATVMENAIKLVVPSVCDVAIGKSWGEAV